MSRFWRWTFWDVIRVRLGFEGGSLKIVWKWKSLSRSNSLWPHGLCSPWNSPGKNTRVGSLSLLQGIFPTQGLNPGLPHCRRILYQLSHKGSPIISAWFNITTTIVFWIDKHQRIDAFELWCWRRLLRVPWTERRSNQSILKGINPEYSLEGLKQKLKLQYFGRLMRKANSLEETLMLGTIEGKTGDDRGWDGWMASLTQWTWVWGNSGR